MQGFPEAKKRGKYKLAERLRTKQEIYRMILNGYTYAKIMEELQISERTLYRYLDIIFSEEQDFLEETLGGREEMKRQIRICSDRLLEDRRILQEWIKDRNFKDKVNAIHLASEIAAVIVKLYDSGPVYLSRRYAFPRYSSLTERKGTTGARLMLKKSLQQPLEAQRQQQNGEELYDELDYDYEEEEKMGDEENSYGFG